MFGVPGRVQVRPQAESDDLPAPLPHQLPRRVAFESCKLPQLQDGRLKIMIYYFIIASSFDMNISLAQHWSLKNGG